MINKKSDKKNAVTSSPKRMGDLIQKLTKQGGGDNLAASSLAQLMGEQKTVKLTIKQRLAERDLFDTVSVLADKMFSEYGPLWAKNPAQGFETSDYWLARLANDGITPQQIALGFKKCLRDPRFEQFPPKIRQFIELCNIRPEDYGFPSPEQAFRDACGISGKRKDQLHDAVRAAMQIFGIFELKGRTDASVKKEFTYIYDQIVKDLIDGKPMPVVINKALPNEESVIVKTEKGFREGIDAMRQAIENAKP